MKEQLKFSAVAGLVLAAGGLGLALFATRASATTLTQNPRPAALAARPGPWSALPHANAVVARPEAPAFGSSGVLDRRHQFALGMLETGNHDAEIGGAGEVSRYQIMPSVWRCYSVSQNYRNPQVALAVARQHWAVLHDTFKQQAGREPTDFDMYVLWNTNHGYYSGRNFDPARLAPVVRDRAQRYVNLVQAVAV